MLKRSVGVVGLAAFVGGCALAPLQYKRASVQPTALGTVCVKTHYWDPCVPMQRDRLRTDATWRALLGDDKL